MMRQLPLIAVVVGCLVTSGASDSKDVKKLQGQLQGSWQVTEFALGGQAFPAEALKRFSVVIEGEQVSLAEDGRREKEKFDWSLKLDVTAKPWGIDLIPLHGDSKGKVLHCCFEIVGDKLRVCGEHESGKRRPTEFSSPADSKLLLIRLQRSKR